jgi:bifunctional non-homologous end joining protein LigD
MEEKTYKSDCVIIKHDAKRAGLHYDLRIGIEKDKYYSFRLIYDASKNLKVPNFVNRIKAIKRNDHTKEEAYFTGTIPEGEYGGGTLSEYSKSDIELRTDEEFKIVLHHLNGKYKNETWVLIKTTNVWILFKTKLK